MAILPQRFMKTTFFTFFILFAIKYAYPQNKSIYYKKDALTFDLTFNNPNSTALHIVKVGVKCHKISGSFICASDDDILNPIADYTIEPWVGKDNETIINADPILLLEPKKSVRFTISVSPNATGECSKWSVQISAIVIFDDSTKIYSKPYLISSMDVFNSQNVQPKDKQILSGLKNQNSEWIFRRC